MRSPHLPPAGGPTFGPRRPPRARFAGPRGLALASTLSGLCLLGGCGPAQARSARSPASATVEDGAGQARLPPPGRASAGLRPVSPPATPPAAGPAGAAAPTRLPPAPLQPAEAALLDGLAAAAPRARAGDLVGALLGLDPLRARAPEGAAARWVDRRVRSWLTHAAGRDLSDLAARLAPSGRFRGLVLAEWSRRAIAAGNESQARKLVAAAGASLRESERDRLLAAAGDPNRIGALVPLSGRWRTVGYRLLEGMALAAGLVGRPHSNRVVFEVRDSNAQPAAVLADLARRGVVAVVGLPRSGRARAVRALAQAHRIPCLVAADGQGLLTRAPRLFRAVHSPPARARALAAFAASRGLRRVAVLHLQGGYGKRTAAAFSDEARRRGLQVVATLAYPRGDKTLYARFAPLARQPMDAVFVADSARHLEVVAPQLALAGFRIRPAPARPAARTSAQPGGRRGGAASRHRGRPGVVLLSTGEGLADRLRQNAGAAVLGAVLAPGYYPDLSDPLLGGFARAYYKAYGVLPDRYAAAGYLAVLHLRSLLVTRAQGRVSLSRALRAVPPTPAAPLRHDPSGERVDPPFLYEVRANGIFRILNTPP